MEFIKLPREQVILHSATLFYFVSNVLKHEPLFVPVCLEDTARPYLVAVLKYLKSPSPVEDDTSKEYFKISSLYLEMIILPLLKAFSQQLQRKKVPLAEEKLSMLKSELDKIILVAMCRDSWQEGISM
jgi:hypothetical protein